MKKLKGIVLTGILLVGGMAIYKNASCENCGEKFNNVTSMIEEICNPCFTEMGEKALNTESGILLNFADGTGYYFSNDGI